MKKKKKEPLSFLQRLQKIKNAGLTQQRPPTVFDPWQETLPTLGERIRRIFDLYEKYDTKPGTMIYFIMYDIENNKVRTQIAKYLKKKGCVRVQKSIFLASSTAERFNEIHSDIKEVQEVYDNFDSIFFVPVSMDQLKSMKVIGKSVDYEIITGNKKTLII